MMGISNEMEKECDLIMSYLLRKMNKINACRTGLEDETEIELIACIRLHMDRTFHHIINLFDYQAGNYSLEKGADGLGHFA